MKYDLQVVTAGNTHKFLDDLEQRLKWIRDRGYRLDISFENNEGLETDIVIFKLEDNNRPDGIFRYEDIIYIFKHQLSEALAEHIVGDWELRLLWKEISRSCRMNSADDRKKLYSKAEDFLKSCHDNDSLNLLMNFGRKNRIAHRIFEHIEKNDCLVVEGFINFCMKDYLTEIRFAVEVAVEELRSEKEYNEFVNLLRYFVETQVPKMLEVNVLVDNEGLFYLWDEKGLTIEQNYMNYYMEDIILDRINLDDVLVSILITIAPRRIIIHHGKELIYNEPLEMLKNVFEEQIIICSGCERCMQLKSEHRLQHPR